METGKTGKYFKYAIGEILLVMIGILLALQVSNWNDKRLARLNEIKTLKQLNVDLKTNLAEIKVIDSLINLRASAGKKILNHFVHNDSATDSLKYWVELFSGRNIFNNANTTYKNLENSNNTIITNDSLRIGITLMYETGFANIHIREQMFENTYLEVYQEQLFKKFKAGPTMYKFFDEISQSINTPKNYTDLRKNEDFKTTIVFANNFRILRLNWLSATQTNLKDLINNVEKEIEKLQ